MKTLGWSVLASITVAAGAGGWACFTLYTADLQEDLVREANLVFAGPRPRPVHVDRATPGTLGDALARDLPALEEAAVQLADPDALKRLREVTAGARPVAELPREYAQLLKVLAGRLDGVIAGTHAERADLAPATDPIMPAEGATWAGYQLAAKLVAVRIRQALAAGRGDEAARLCLDGLALGRDAGVAGGLVGRMVRCAVTGIVEPACASAATAPGVDRMDLVRRVRTVRDAVPGPAAMMREEAATMQLMIFGWQLSAERRSRLLPRAAAEAAQSARPPALGPELLERTAWRGVVRGYRELGAALALPPADRDAALERFERRWSARLHPKLSAFAQLGPSFARYTARDEGAVLRHDLVVCAALARAHRDAQGRWPDRLDDLPLDAGERARVQGAELAEEGGRFRIRLELPAIDGEQQSAGATLEP